jgi:hypothetical protein
LWGEQQNFGGYGNKASNPKEKGEERNIVLESFSGEEKILAQKRRTAKEKRSSCEDQKW